MAAPRQQGHRVFASPARRTERPRYYYNTERGSFYSIPSRRITHAQRLDVIDLMEIAETRRDFRITKSGDVHFRGHSLTALTGRPQRGWNILKHPQPWARLRGRKRLPKGPDVPPEIQSYLETIASRNPSYHLEQIIVTQEGEEIIYTGIFRGESRGTAFAVSTS